MKSYILLRDNRESGPYTLRELKALSLRPLDLIWIEGESTSWQYSTEINELKASVKPVEKNKKASLKTYTASTKREAAFDTKTASQKTPQFAPSSMPSQHHDFYTSSYYEELKNTFNKQTAPKRKYGHFAIGQNLIGLTVLVTGIFMIAVMTKKAFVNLGNEPLVTTAEAYEIQNEKLPTSEQPHEAKIIAPVMQNFGAVTGSLPSQLMNLHAKMVTQTAATAKADQNSNAISQPAAMESNRIDANNSNTVVLETTPKEEKNVREVNEIREVKGEDKPEATEKAVGKPSLQLIANDYKVGLLGGIKNLELLLTNPSTQTVDKASVEVQYLKPNGNVVNSQNFDVFDIVPGGSKKIVVPDNSRGVSVRYRIITIDTHVGKIVSKNM